MKTLTYALTRLAPFFTLFFFVQIFVRAALFLYDGTDIDGAGLSIPAAFLVGAGFDVAVFCYYAIPFLLYALCLPKRLQGTHVDRVISSVFFFIFTYILLFTAVGEYFFWDEFQTRYNFIAVDYLVYTTEVIGNIRESYPMGTLLSAFAIASLFAAVVYYKNAKLPSAVPFSRRLFAFLSALIFSLVSFFAANSGYAEISQNRYINEISKNGVFELFSAFRNNELDYKKFYITKPDEEIATFLREKIGKKSDSASPLDHFVTNKKAAKKYNLIVITVESLSAEFLTMFGNEAGITPHLDKLVDQSLFFSNLYATGTRTVYGLSALTLSTPPIPGNAIVRRADNGNLFSLGHVLRGQGYDTKFIYGGFGYFDNMNAFFSANGYGIVDRSDLEEDEITFANIWGVSDDDIFRKTMKENDAAHAKGKPFFDMIMTTSNHRPYTYPEGRIDLPPKSGRRGGVKYTDYAIDYFLTESKKHAWFKDTIFVIVADHTAGSSGKSELDPEKYHIPMWIYAPGIIKPAMNDALMSQMDVAPTILGLMGVSYDSRFYGRDLMKEQPGRAFISNYQQLGYLTKEGLVILKPNRQVDFFTKNEKGEYLQQKDVPQNLVDDAVGYYQGASYWKEWSRAQ